MKSKRRKRLIVRKPTRDGYRSRYHALLKLKKKGQFVTFVRRRRDEKERFQIYAAAKYWLGASNISIYQAGKKRFKVVLRRGR